MSAHSISSGLTIEPSRAAVASGEYVEFPNVARNSPFRPNKQYFVEALAEGTMVGIRHIKEYPTFFKLFARYNGYHKLKQKLYIRQVREDLWLLIAQKSSEPKPGMMLDGDFREHGRYKWYAEQLNKGEEVTVDSENDARKCRRAWMLYTPTELRGDRESVIEAKSKKYRVFLRRQDHG